MGAEIELSLCRLVMRESERLPHRRYRWASCTLNRRHSRPGCSSEFALLFDSPPAPPRSPLDVPSADKQLCFTPCLTVGGREQGRPCRACDRKGIKEALC